MSTLKNSKKSVARIHRERQQPAHRKKLGLLEKHKDYVVRARDQEKKNDSLKQLHRKALEHNPDEFFYHMINSKMEDGVHVEIEKKPETDTNEQELLMATQDIRYIRFKRQVERKKIEKMKASLHLSESFQAPQNKHTFFVDSKEEAVKFNLCKRLETHPAVLDRSYNRPRLQDLHDKVIVNAANRKEIKQVNAERKRSYNELEKRLKREKELALVEQKLYMRQQLAKTESFHYECEKEATPTEAPVYRFPFRRKR